MSMNSDDQLVIARLDDVPPPNWVRGKTSDQIELFTELKQVFQIIKFELHSYFSGQPSPQIAFLDKRTQTIYGLISRRYLDLYAAIRSNWGEIKQKATALQVNIPKTPGECLAAIIENDALGMLEPTSRYHEVRSRRLGDLYRMEGKIQAGRASEREIKRFEASIKRLHSDLSDYLGLFLFCISVLSESSNPEVKELFKRYNRTTANLDRELSAGFHPRKCDHSYNWVQGRKVYVT